jgi:lipoyl(octanoyl) transferase
MLEDGLRFRKTFARDDDLRPEWVVSHTPVPYPAAIEFMEQRVADIIARHARERVWLLEHLPLYTPGISAKPSDLLAPERFEVFRTDRGGQYTYHGPGQRVVYLMLDLNRRQKDLRGFVEALEQWIIDTLWAFNVEGHIRAGRVGVWVERKDNENMQNNPQGEPISAEGKGERPSELMRGALAAPERYKEDKIAAIGIKMRKWVSFHGISLNVEPDLSHFDGIVPCGIVEHGVTSLVGLGLPVTLDEVDYALKCAFETHFGPVAE